MKFDYKKVIKPEINVGDKEQRYRILGGVVLVFISIFTASIILLLLGLVLIVTGYFGRCPAYAGINFNTLEKGAAAPATETSVKAAEPEPAAKPAAEISSPASKAKPAAKKAATSKAKPVAKKTTSASKAKTSTKKTTAKAKAPAEK